MNLLETCSKKFLGLLGLTCAALLVLSALPQHAAPQSASDTLVFDVDSNQSKVHWTLNSTLHTVHGTFALKQGAVSVNPGTGQASGEIVADAASGESGNDSRDKEMHKEVLESDRYKEIVFRPDRVEGKLNPLGISNLRMHGIFLLHGSEHELTVPVAAELASDRWKGSAKFSVPYVQWGLKNPSNFLLRVKPAVTIELEMTGKLQTSASQ
jgi:hypothetical protein